MANKPYYQESIKLLLSYRSVSDIFGNDVAREKLLTKTVIAFFHVRHAATSTAIDIRLRPPVNCLERLYGQSLLRQFKISSDVILTWSNFYLVATDEVARLTLKPDKELHGLKICSRFSIFQFTCEVLQSIMGVWTLKKNYSSTCNIQFHCHRIVADLSPKKCSTWGGSFCYP